MVLQQSVKNILSQLVDSLQLLSNEQYCREIPTLSDSSIGHHVRHVIEMFILLQEGLSSGIVNYEKRNRGSPMTAPATARMNRALNSS
jgi:hypothetical protein